MTVLGGVVSWVAVLAIFVLPLLRSSAQRERSWVQSQEEQSENEARNSG